MGGAKTGQPSAAAADRPAAFRDDAGQGEFGGFGGHFLSILAVAAKLGVTGGAQIAIPAFTVRF